MAKSQENIIGMKCSACESRNYVTRKNKKNIQEKLELSKYCKKCKKHTPHKELSGNKY